MLKRRLFRTRRLIAMVVALSVFAALSAEGDFNVTITMNAPDNGVASSAVVASCGGRDLVEPSTFDAADPRRMVRYFCRMWKEEEYEKMYFAMTPKYRDSISFKKFVSLFENDADRSGGLKDENIIVDDVDEGKIYTITVDLQFNFKRAKIRRVKAVLERGKNGYRIRSSGIVPVDIGNL